MVKAACFHCWGQGFIRELRSCKLHGQKQTSKITRKNILCLQTSINIHEMYRQWWNGVLTGPVMVLVTKAFSEYVLT